MIYLYGNTTQTYKLSQQANTLNYGLSHFGATDKILGLKAVVGNMAGGDDHCGYTRFKTLEDAKKWFVSDEFIDYSNPEYWMVN